MESVVLPIHITAGTFGVLAGAAALTLRKGARAHRVAGSIFLLSMTMMAVTAAVLGGDVGNMVAAGMTIYMVSTGWGSARRGDNQAGLFEVAAFVVASLCAIALGWSAVLIATGAREAINPYIAYVTAFISGVLALAGLGDLSVVLRHGLSGAQRIARHLWRMCFGLFIAVGSFAAQGAEALPPVVPAPALLFGSMTIVLIAMFYWLARVLLTGWSPRAPQPS